MPHLSNKAGWIALGIVVGVGSSLLLGANQPAAGNNDRYEVNIDFSMAGGLLTAHDRDENRILVYQIKDEEEAELLGVIDLNTLGQETLSITGLDQEDEEGAED